MLKFTEKLILILLAFSLSIVSTSFSLADEVLEKILAMKYFKETAPPIRDFTAFGGHWAVDEQGMISVEPDMGPKLVCTHPELQNLTEGEVAVEILCPEAPTSGYVNAGILIKVQNPGLGADAFHGYEIAISPDFQHLNIGRHRNNYESIAQPPCELELGKWHRLHVRFQEQGFEVLLDDRSIHQFTDTEFPLVSGGLALRPWQREAKYRNLQIKTSKDAPWKRIPFVKNEQPQGELFPETLATDKLPPILFLSRHALTQPSAVGQDLMQKARKPGCSIRLMTPAMPSNPIRTIFEDPEGSIYDMNLSLDAKTIYFSYMGKNDRNWHLWKVHVDGTGLERLTDGTFCDVSPCEIPGGDLIFVSTRRHGHTVCQPGPASNLYRLFRTGTKKRHIACISMNTLSDLSPQMLPDGRVLFTRWEYIDRDLTYRQSLWTQHPNGAGYRLFFGNTIRDVGTFWQARPLPGSSDQLVATFAPHHGFPHGAIGLIDRRFGVEGEKGKGFRYLTTNVERIGDTNFPWGYRDPFPLDEETFLCSYGDEAGFFPEHEKRFKIYLLDLSGRKRLLYEDEQMSCCFPIPLQETQIASLAELPEFIENESFLLDPEIQQPTGTMVLVDVEQGLQGKVAPGTIRSLRIMEQVRKTEDIVHRAYDQSPVMSYGTYYAKRDWGTVPLETDGSACFTVPALREIYFQALDAEGREVQRMTSAIQVMPGETVACIGCHESRDSTPHRQQVPLAVRKSPKIPESPDWLLNRPLLNPEPDSRTFDYPSVIQPILDKYCLSCHEGPNPDGGYDLSGDKTRFFSMSYDNLLGRSQSYRQHNMETGEMLPEEAAKGKPLVHFYWLLWTPTAVNQPYWTGSHASRLTELIESDHFGVQMPLEDRQKIYYWIDANVPYYGTYAHSRPLSAGRRDRFANSETGEYRSWYSDEFHEVYNRRCVSCHGPFETPAHLEWTGKYAWINLSRPENSPALTAHLVQSEGGRGIPMPDQESLFFESKNDPDYMKMLHAIEQGRSDMLQHPEADMSGFRFSKKEP